MGKTHNSMTQKKTLLTLNVRFFTALYRSGFGMNKKWTKKSEKLFKFIMKTQTKSEM